MRHSGKLIITLAFIFLQLFSIGQEIQIVAKNKPLNKVLIEIIVTEKVNISFDDAALSKIIVDINNSFSSVDDALKDLLSNTDHTYEYIGDVWIIYPKVKSYEKTISGIVIDRGTNEALSYSHLSIDGWPAISTLSGNFSFSTISSDSMLNVRVSHLGYYILDTCLSFKNHHTLKLNPSSIGLSEVVISDRKIEKSTQSGQEPGLLKLNHKIAGFLPGYGDNSVFNLMRLMPGILASGEHTSEQIIWGSYAGQSEVLFDGYTVFGIKNFNDNISSFNPLLAKSIEIYKGGYDARFGGRVGGIINIIGKNGNPQKFGATLTINNMTLNGLVEIPVGKRSSLIIAMRHTYYNLYNSSDMTALVKQNNDADSTNDIDITIKPDYVFRDLNLKFSSTFKNNDLFYISLHGADDRFSYSINEPIKNRILDKNTRENNYQIGGTTYYSHNWNNGNISSVSLSYSSIESGFKDNYKILIPRNNQTNYLTDEIAENFLEEYKVKFSNNIHINKIHHLKAGIEFYRDRVTLSEYSFGALISYLNRSANRLSIFFQDRISANKNISFQPGLRLVRPFNLHKTFIEPRLATTINIGQFWRVVASAGVYNQFITLSTNYDNYGNYKYFWTISDGEEIPVLNSLHFVLGTRYFKNNFTVNIEGYYKGTDGLTRFHNFTNYNVQDIFHGSSRSYGIDILLKKDFKNHSAWIAYSLGNTTEEFQFYNQPRRAPQDQRHELKLAMMLNFEPIFISSNYIYGSGFPVKNGPKQNSIEEIPYSRLDLSVIYKFLDRKFGGEAGISILNVLNTKNIKYQSFEKIPANQLNEINILTEAIPFTPTLYLKISI